MVKIKQIGIGQMAEVSVSSNADWLKLPSTEITTKSC